MIYFEPVKATIGIEDFAQIDLRVGKVTVTSEVSGSSKLIKLSVDFGEEQRTIFTGLAKWYESEHFLGKLFVFVYNLEPKPMVGEESQGMLLAVGGEDKPLPVEAPVGSDPGDKLS
ncbi:MAG: tRNA-binding protein [Microgenomates group bacterium Gr01-1014_5]|nr:MAG: tRNA-binding protein [Microgenomates group bacterium Gr01-1014_5]